MTNKQVAVLTEEEIKKLKNCKTKNEWNSTCDKIVERCDGYPDDWYEIVICGGILYSD